MVTNYANGTLAPGAGVSTAGTVLTVNSNLTLLAGSTNLFQVSHHNATNDSVVSSGTITYGGVLMVVTNAGDSAFTNGDKFTLFVSSSGYVGSFSATNLPPLNSGLAWSNSLSIDGSIEVISNAVVQSVTGLQFTARPVISGTSLTISGTNTGAGTIYLLTSTNVAAHLNTWTPVWTNVLGGSSSFTTNLSGVVTPGSKQQFYILSSTNN